MVVTELFKVYSDCKFSPGRFPKIEFSPINVFLCALIEIVLYKCGHDSTAFEWINSNLDKKIKLSYPERKFYSQAKSNHFQWHCWILSGECSQWLCKIKNLALKELGDVEEDGEEEGWEKVGEKVVPIFCCVLLPPGRWASFISIMLFLLCKAIKTRQHCHLSIWLISDCNLQSVRSKEILWSLYNV